MQIDHRQMDLFGSVEQGSSNALKAVAVVEVEATPIVSAVIPIHHECTDAVGLESAAVQPILSAAVMTLAEHENLMARVDDGEVPVDPDEVRSSFERLVRDADSIRGELGKFKVADLLKRLGGSFVHDRKKPYLIEKVLDGLICAYGFLCVTSSLISIQGIGLEQRANSIRLKLAKLTAEQLAAYRAYLNAEREERKAKLLAYAKALKTPETLPEFDLFIRKHSESALTPEMRARRDELVAEKLRAEQTLAAEKPVVVGGVDASTGMQLVETVHTRDKYALFVVKLAERVERDVYAALNTAAKKLGGRYSSYNRDGAVPGFQFRDRDAAEQFLLVGRGESVTKQTDTEALAAEKSASAAERLKGLAQSTKDVAEEGLTRERMTNTVKRASQASAAQETARKDIALAKTMDSLADAIEQGTVKHLDRLTDKSQVVLFSALLRAAKQREINATSNGYAEELARKGEEPTLATVDYVTYPEFGIYVPDQVDRLIGEIASISGLKRLSTKLKPYANEARRDGARVSVPEEIALPIVNRLGRDRYQLPNNWVDAAEERKRLQRMGITTVEQLRAACREFLRYRHEADKADRATELERAIVGTEVGLDFFPSPDELCTNLVQNVLRRMKVRTGKWLEPSAGTGSVASAIRSAGYEPDVVELSPALREVLAAKGFNIIGSDFLEIEGSFGAIVMNPPFSSDIRHVRHAWSLLEEGGALSSVVGEGAFTRNDAEAVEFRKWLEELGAEIEKLPSGTFADRKLLKTTGAAARVVTLAR
ncbi:hypothetical protein [Burkholderia sp. Ac-20365]|uniref:hypothetical protein n=1 Tax=Burkholderia sp. Ac-20365 TaxID=2703897 RepID=UPI00197CA7A7|nr:hypothetical protein [Burkholderia sp. Ac-20365]MBN3760916.1 hypothetical protein [Burkholderia sp. Ac-20365]